MTFGNIFQLIIFSLIFGLSVGFIIHLVNVETRSETFCAGYKMIAVNGYCVAPENRIDLMREIGHDE